MNMEKICDQIVLTESFQRIVLAERMPLEIVRQNNSFHIRMTDKFDSEKIKHLSLRPVGTLEYLHKTRDFFPFFERAFQHNSFETVGIASEQITYLKTGILFAEPVNCSQIIQKIKLQFRILFQAFGDRNNAFRFDEESGNIGLYFFFLINKLTELFV